MEVAHAVRIMLELYLTIHIMHIIYIATCTVYSAQTLFILLLLCIIMYNLQGHYLYYIILQYIILYYLLYITMVNCNLHCIYIYTGNKKIFAVETFLLYLQAPVTPRKYSPRNAHTFTRVGELCCLATGPAFQMPSGCILASGLWMHCDHFKSVGGSGLGIRLL